MCLLHYLHRNLMHTRASLVQLKWACTLSPEPFWVLITWQQMLARHANVYKGGMVHAKPFEDEIDSKEHSESQNEHHVIESYQNNQPVNLSPHTRKQNLQAGFACFHFIGFMFHTAFWVDTRVLKWWRHKNLFFWNNGFCSVVLNDLYEKGSHSKKMAL